MNYSTTEDEERELREAAEKQAAMIKVALAYLRAGQPDLARQVLEAAEL